MKPRLAFASCRNWRQSPETPVGQSWPVQSDSLVWREERGVASAPLTFSIANSSSALILSSLAFSDASCLIKATCDHNIMRRLWREKTQNLGSYHLVHLVKDFIVVKWSGRHGSSKSSRLRPIESRAQTRYLNLQVRLSNNLIGLMAGNLMVRK